MTINGGKMVGKMSHLLQLLSITYWFTCVYLKVIETRAKAKMLEWLKIITVSPRSHRDCSDISGKTEDWPNLKETTRTMLTVIVIGNMMPKERKTEKIPLF